MTHQSDQKNQVPLDVSVDMELWARAVAAAKLEEIDLATLVTRGLSREISETEYRYRTILLSPDDYERFMSLVEEIRPLSPTLERAARDRLENGFDFGIKGDS